MVILAGGLPCWLSGKESTCQCKSREFNPWIRKSPLRMKWQPTPVFLPGKSHGQRSLAGSLVAQMVKNPPAMRET